MSALSCNDASHRLSPRFRRETVTRTAVALISPFPEYLGRMVPVYPNSGVSVYGGRVALPAEATTFTPPNPSDVGNEADFSVAGSALTARGAPLRTVSIPGAARRRGSARIGRYRGAKQSGAAKSLLKFLRSCTPMFGLFNRKFTDPLSQPSVGMIRSHTRTLIRFANDAERAGARDTDPDDGAGKKTKERQAMASGETQLASSIAAAVSGDVSIRSIVDDVIRPTLRQAIVVSETAHDAIFRAIGLAERR